MSGVSHRCIEPASQALASRRASQPRRATPGVLIAAEGLDGSGKSAGLDALGRWLERQGSARPRRRPGNRHVSSRGRPAVRAVVSSSRRGLRPLLAAAEAADRIGREVRRPLERGDVVLADRYAWTGRRAGGRARPRPGLGRPPSTASRRRPDLVVFHRQDTDAALARALATRTTPAAAEAVGSRLSRRSSTAPRGRLRTARCRSVASDRGRVPVLCSPRGSRAGIATVPSTPGSGRRSTKRPARGTVTGGRDRSGRRSPARTAIPASCSSSRASIAPAGRPTPAASRSTSATPAGAWPERRSRARH